MTAQVAIDLSLDRLFTYAVPEELEKKLAVGQLLSVPFGHREARGFALVIHGEPSGLASPSPLSLPTLSSLSSGEGERREGREGREGQETEGQERRRGHEADGPRFALKPIRAIVDETPFFSPTLLELVRRTAAYFAAPLESVLRAAVPAAVLKKNAHAKELLFVEPVAGERGERQEGQERQEKLEAAGRERLVGPAAQLSKRQQWLYEQIVRLGGGWMSPLCHELKTTPASLRILAVQGYVTIAAKAKRRNPLARGRVLPTKPLPLNAEQQAALEMIAGQATPRPVLLFGVTGSGKTEVYLQAIARELEAGRGAIVMVPEISLTPQTVQRFASRFGDRVAVLHSALSDGERYDEWHRIRSGEARVVVGPRSAVWAPVQKLGLIVVDEEHETSYKQEDNPRYHARDIAVLRGALEGAKVVLGSATPSLESWMNVKRGKYALATMKSRAGAGTLPRVNLVEMHDGSIYSKDLLDAIRLRLDRHEQTILFLNRRGFSRALTCEACGDVVTCPACDIPYTYHQADDCLRCHVCGAWIPTPHACPKCHHAAYTYTGVGTQRAEAALRRFFERARILRMDADSTSRKNSHDDILGAFRRQEADILIGTQMIAKGLDFPNVTLVGVLNADSALYMPDFRAAERTYQLLAQVSGRAGRAELPGEVFIQTHDPTVAVIRAARFGDYVRFAEQELNDRREANFPPFCHLAVIGLRSPDLRLVGDWASMYAESLKRLKGLVVSEAMPSALVKADGWYRWQVVLRAASASLLSKSWRWISSVRPAPKNLRITIDIDAYNLV